MTRGRAKIGKPNNDAMVHYVTKYTTKDNIVPAFIVVLSIDSDINLLWFFCRYHSGT